MPDLNNGRKTMACDRLIYKTDPKAPFILGILEGEGVGPELTRCALEIVSVLKSKRQFNIEIQHGGLIGQDSESVCGKALSDEVIDFCRDIFSAQGAILAGPGAGRFVYDLRREFDLFCKLVPLKAFERPLGACRIKTDYLTGVDILLVRENMSGIYMGEWEEIHDPEVGRKICLRTSYCEKEVERILKVANRLAASRKKKLMVVIKDGGLPQLSELWRNCSEKIASSSDVAFTYANIDLAGYYFVQHAQELDVVVGPNLFGDILADIGGALMGSRGLTYSANCSQSGAAVYQTNHGAAFDLVGTGRANPVGHIFALAMMLRESYGLFDEARLVEKAVEEVWRQGWRTDDLAEPGCRSVGTIKMTDLIVEAIMNG